MHHKVSIVLRRLEILEIEVSIIPRILEILKSWQCWKSDFSPFWYPGNVGNARILSQFSGMLKPKWTIRDI